MKKSLTRIQKIVDGLKKCSRSSTQNEKQITPINEIIADALGIVEIKSKRHNVPIHVELESKSSIYADAIDIEQVIINLYQSMEKTL